MRRKFVSLRESIISEIVNWIQIHYQEPLTLTGLSRHRLPESCYFSTKFKASRNLPKEYILNTRMDAAESQLSDTGPTIRQIAVQYRVSK